MDKLEKEIKQLIDLSQKLPDMPQKSRKALAVSEALRYRKIIAHELGFSSWSDMEWERQKKND